MGGDIMRAHPVLVRASAVVLCIASVAVCTASTPKVSVRFINAAPNTFLTGKATQVDPVKGPLHPKTLGKNLGYSFTTRLKKKLKDGNGLFAIFEGDLLVDAAERSVSGGQGINLFAVKGSTRTADVLLVPWPRTGIPEGQGWFNFVQTIADAPTLELEIERASNSAITTYGDVAFKTFNGSYLVPDSYEFHLRVQGTSTILDSGGFTPVEGQALFLVFMGTYDSTDDVPITHRVLMDNTKK
jgi:hypothetical protein